MMLSTVACPMSFFETVSVPTFDLVQNHQLVELQDNVSSKQNKSSFQARIDEKASTEACESERIGGNVWGETKQKRYDDALWQLDDIKQEISLNLAKQSGRCCVYDHWTQSHERFLCFPRGEYQLPRSLANKAINRVVCDDELKVVGYQNKHNKTGRIDLTDSLKGNKPNNERIEHLSIRYMDELFPHEFGSSKDGFEPETYVRGANGRISDNFIDSKESIVIGDGNIGLMECIREGATRKVNHVQFFHDMDGTGSKCSTYDGISDAQLRTWMRDKTVNGTKRVNLRDAEDITIDLTKYRPSCTKYGC